MTLPLKNLVRLGLITAGMLLVPLVAMQFTREVTWTLLDFVTAGALLFGSGLTYELLASKGSSTVYRLAVGAAVATGLLLVWLNLAVGLIGSEHNPANQLYGGVLAVGFVGAIVARFRPLGMAWALLATALAQVAVPLLTLALWKPQATTAADSWDTTQVIGVTALFMGLWLGSAWLFRHASLRNLSHKQPPA